MPSFSKWRHQCQYVTPCITKVASHCDAYQASHQPNIVTVTSHHFNTNGLLRYQHMSHHCMIYTNSLNGMKMVLLKQWWHVMPIHHTKYRDCIVTPHHHITPINWGFAIIPHHHTSQTSIKYHTTLIIINHWNNTTTFHDFYQTFRWYDDTNQHLKQWWYTNQFITLNIEILHNYTSSSHHTNQPHNHTSFNTSVPLR